MKNSIEEIGQYYIPMNFGYIKDGKLYKKAPFSVNIEMSAVIILLIMIVQGIFFFKGESIYIFWYTYIPLVIIIIYGLIKRYQKGDIHYFFDRKTGALTFPKNIFNEQEKVYEFKNLYFDFYEYQSFEKREDNEYYLIYDVIPSVTKESFIKHWSFYLWYMDKNRPLPPSSIFNEFRQQDFERRKAAGFPKPIYKSNIKTPEATKTQQAMRKRIGNW